MDSSDTARLWLLGGVILDASPRPVGSWLAGKGRSLPMPRSRVAVRFAAQLLLVLAIAAAGPASALSTSGAVVEIPAPPSVELDALESNSQIYLFQESTSSLLADIDVDITLPGTYTDPASVSSGVVAAGTAVTSYFLQFDTIASQLVTGIGGAVTFDTDILGVMVFDATLDASDGSVGLGSVTYPTGLTFRGTEISPDSFRDSVTLSASLRTLTINRLGVDLVHDQIRVITVAVPEPASALLVSGGLLLFGASRARAQSVRSRARRPSWATGRGSS